MKPRLSHVVEYAALRAVSGLLGLLPHRVALALGWGPARLIYFFGRRLRERTRDRMRQALGGDRPDREWDRLGRLAFRNLVFTAVEGMRLPSIRTEWVARHFDVGALQEVRDELAKGRGLIVAVPHMGNWELAGIALQSQGIPLATLVRKQKNPLMNDWINRLRMSTGVEAIETHRRHEVATMPERLAREGRALALLPDVRSRKGGVPVRFLGVEIEVPGGAAHYARAGGTAILTAEVVRTGWMRHGWRKTGWIEPDPSLPEDVDRRRIMQYILDRFSESVRAHPENYFWFNKRWVLADEEGR